MDSNEKEVIVRFAPSPTGYLLVGGARTAIFNWLFARKHGGKMILRIEDTDAERSTQGSIEGIVEGLKWLGITWDEGPIFQSRFIKDHQTAARGLLESGHAYRCFCTKEALQRKRDVARERKATYQYDGTCRNLDPEDAARKVAEALPYTIRLKVPRGGGSICFSDIVCGTIEKKHVDIEDFVIVRSNGDPLYVLSNAVDDIRDGITHVIRGQDGLANTPKQILIYEALGVPLPKFAHMSLALDPAKAKISKRKHGELVAVHFYREHGFLPWAFVNFLALLGWSTADSKQAFSREELLEAFSLQGLSKANCVFDIRADDSKFLTDPKAISINAHYLRSIPVEALAAYVKTELEKAGIWDEAFEGEARHWFLETIGVVRDRFSFTTDFATLGRAYFSDDFQIDPEALEKNVLKHEAFGTWFGTLADRFEAMGSFGEEGIEEVIRVVMEESGIKAGKLVNGIRTAVTGQGVGPGILEALMCVGQDRTVARLRGAASLL